jgi:hypothetical protein
MISGLEHRHLSKSLAAIEKFKAKKARINLLTPMCGLPQQTTLHIFDILKDDFHLSKLRLS